MTKLLLHITIFLITNLCLGQITVQSIWHHQAYNDVFVIEDGDTVNLTKFNQWQEIVDFALSPDSVYCFIRHKPNVKNTSYRLALYHIKTKKLVKEIVPGFGGDFVWNNHHQIIHSWGCGTNCANLRVYNLQLEVIFSTLSEGGFKFSPEKNFVVQLNMSGAKLWVFDLKSLKKHSNPLTFIAEIDFEYDWEDLHFADEYTLAFENRRPKAIDLKGVDWRE